jgi:hypothetical protein
MEEKVRDFTKLVLLTLQFPLRERSAVEGSLARHHYHAMKIAYRTKEVPGEKEPYPNQEDMSGLKQTARQTASVGRTYCQASVSLTLNFVAVTSQLDHLLEASLLPVHQSRRRFSPGTPATTASAAATSSLSNLLTLGRLVRARQRTGQPRLSLFEEHGVAGRIGRK